MFKKIISLLFFVNLVFIIGIKVTFAQDFAKLFVTGSNIQVIYNTLNQYENGITLTGWSKVKVSIKCPSCKTTGWELRMFAHTDALNYQGGESGVIDIDFTDFEISVNLLGSPPGLTVYSPYTLQQATPYTSDGLILIKGTGGIGIGAGDPPFEFEFTLSYSLPGMQNRTKEGGLFYTVIELFILDN